MFFCTCYRKPGSIGLNQVNCWVEIGKCGDQKIFFCIIFVFFFFLFACYLISPTYLSYHCCVINFFLNPWFLDCTTRRSRRAFVCCLILILSVIWFVFSDFELTQTVASKQRLMRKNKNRKRRKSSKAFILRCKNFLYSLNPTLKKKNCDLNLQNKEIFFFFLLFKFEL